MSREAGEGNGVRLVGINSPSGKRKTEWGVGSQRNRTYEGEWAGGGEAAGEIAGECRVGVWEALRERGSVSSTHERLGAGAGQASEGGARYMLC